MCLQYKSFENTVGSPGFYVSAVQVFWKHCGKPWVLCVCSTSLLKTLWEALGFMCLQYKSFENTVGSPGFYVSAVQVFWKHCGKHWVLCVCSTSLLKTLWEALGFMCLQYKSFENTVGKEEIARNEQFLLFPQCFLPIWMNFLPFSSNLKLSSANSFSLDQSKILSSGNGLRKHQCLSSAVSSSFKKTFTFYRISVITDSIW